MSRADAPHLELDAFAGPLDLLVEQARAGRVDLGRLPLLEIVEQFVRALDSALGGTPLSLLGDWVVLAADLLRLRSGLLLPRNAPERVVAEREASALQARVLRRERLMAAVQALEQRPRLGRDVFARGGNGAAVPQGTGQRRTSSMADLLDACLVVLTQQARRAEKQTARQRLVFWTVGNAIGHMTELLPVLPPENPLERFMPEEPAHSADQSLPSQGAAGRLSQLQHKAAIASTLLASLELARQGQVRLRQERPAALIMVERLDSGMPVAPLYKGTLSCA